MHACWSESTSASCQLASSSRGRDECVCRAVVAAAADSLKSSLISASIRASSSSSSRLLLGLPAPPPPLPTATPRASALDAGGRIIGWPPLPPPVLLPAIVLGCCGGCCLGSAVVGRLLGADVVEMPASCCWSRMCLSLQALPAGQKPFWKSGQTPALAFTLHSSRQRRDGSTHHTCISKHHGPASCMACE